MSSKLTQKAKTSAPPPPPPVLPKDAIGGSLNAHGSYSVNTTLTAPPDSSGRVPFTKVEHMHVRGHGDCTNIKLGVGIPVLEGAGVLTPFVQTKGLRSKKNPGNFGGGIGFSMDF